MVRKCDMPQCQKTAIVDTKTTFGPWAYLCHEHNELHGCKIPALTNVLADIEE